jgi:hypothetical protein
MGCDAGDISEADFARTPHKVTKGGFTSAPWLVMVALCHSLVLPCRPPHGSLSAQYVPWIKVRGFPRG